MKRCWCFTAYNLPQIPTTHSHFRYAIFQKERCPSTKREHYQGYIEFKQGIKLGPLKTAFGDDTIHFEGRLGTAQQARDYCMKKESQIEPPQEFGTFQGGQGHRQDLEDFTKAVIEGKRDWELADDYPVEMLKFSHHAEKLRLCRKPRNRTPPTVNVRWGPPGSGKTRYVYDNHPLEEIFTMEGDYKWFDGYQGQTIALFDDYEGQFKLPFLLQLLDRYPLRVPIKGGFVWWEPTTIYITSNTDPENWYYDQLQVKRQALARRLTSLVYVGAPDEEGDVYTLSI